MKLSEYIEKYGDKQVDVDKLSEFIIEDKVFEPKGNEKYYFLNYFGGVDYCYHNDDETDEKLIEYQQVYHTEAETEFARDKAIFLEFMRKEFLRNSDEIDWEDGGQTKYYLVYHSNRGYVNCANTWKIQHANHNTTNHNWLIYFTEKYEDEIKKYYFEVKED